MDSGYQPLNQDDENLFQLHAAGIDKAVREKFPSIPADYQLKPVTIQKHDACGIFYHFKIALPNGQFAHVSFHSGGLPPPIIPGTAGKKQEEHYDVDSTPSASQYE